VFDHDHLKLLHLLVPIRNLLSYATLKGIDRLPVCFLCPHVDGLECTFKKHNREEFEVAVRKHSKGEKDKHIWRSLDQLMRISGLTQLLDPLAPDVIHSIVDRKLNNFQQILDVTSSVKHAILVDNWQDKRIELIDVMFFTLCATIFINEGPYLVAFLWVYERVSFNLGPRVIRLI
jgi:hypothetical protein